MRYKIKVLLFTSYYFPGYKAGGPIKTILNMVESLSDDIEFWIVTRDRDLGDDQPFKNLKINEWCEVGKANVLYLSADRLRVKSLSKIINKASCDVLYLNSFFEIDFSIKVLLARRLRMYHNLPVVLAPRGEFSKGALSLKSLKKSVFIWLSSWTGLYSNIVWQASTEHEKNDILARINVNEALIQIAKDLPGSCVLPLTLNHSDSVVFPTLRIVFLSRISPMKNLDYALQVLSYVKKTVEFDIYGPTEDLLYWSQCKNKIESLPRNIQIRYLGEVSSDKVGIIFMEYDLFLFPTRGENYGHVIAESLLAGTPVLISDQTPWQNLHEDDLGWNFALNDLDKFVDVINAYPVRTILKKEENRERVRQHALKRIYNSQDIDDNKKLFNTAISLFGKG